MLLDALLETWGIRHDEADLPPGPGRGAGDVAPHGGGDARTVRRFGKGACANLGGVTMSRVAAQMESAARAGKVTEGAALLPALEHQFALLKGELAEVSLCES